MQVRVNALLCLGEVVPRLDKGAVLEILQTLQRCTAVDHSAPTLMCTLGVASAIYKQVCHAFCLCCDLASTHVATQSSLFKRIQNLFQF